MSRLALIATTALLGSLVGWSTPLQAQTPPTLSDKPCIALLAPMTGKAKRLGKALENAVNLAHEAGGPEVTLIIEDTHGTPEGARAAVAQVARNPCVVAAIGPVGWRESKAAAAAAESSRLPIFPLSAEEGLETVGPHVFRVRTSVVDEAEAMAGLAVSDLAIERFAILHPDDAIGRRAAEVFFETVRKRGGRVTALAEYEVGETNFNKVVEELVGRRLPRLTSRKLSRRPTVTPKSNKRPSWVNFDAIFIPDYGGSVTLATHFLTYHDVPLGGLGEGRPIQLLGVGLMRGRHHKEAAGMTTGALYPGVFEANGGLEGIDAFANAFRERYQREPTQVDAQAFDIWRIVGDVAVASRKHGTDPRAAFLTALIKMEPREVLTGKRWFPANGEPGCRFRLWVVDSSGTVSTTDP